MKSQAEMHLNKEKVVKYLMSNKFGRYIQCGKPLNHKAIAKELASFDSYDEDFKLNLMGSGKLGNLAPTQF